MLITVKYMQDFKQSIFNELKDIEFIQKELHELTLKEQQDFCAENLEVLYKDDFGQCAVFLRISDCCAIRNIHGEWRSAKLSECHKMANGTLEGMYHFIPANENIN